MRVIIIGNGIAGSTAARLIRKQSDHSILMISEESEYFFSRTALMYVYMGHLQAKDLYPYEPSFWSKNKIDLLHAQVVELDVVNKQLKTHAGQVYDYDVLIIATGSIPNQQHWENLQLEGVRGFYHWQDLQYISANSEGLRRAVVVGGGLIGVELAEMFHSRQIPVTMLIRESSYWSNVLPREESVLVSNHLKAHHIDCRYNTSLQAILPDESGRCAAVRTNHGEEIATGFVGLTMGVRPNVELFRSTGLEVDKGILVDAYLRSSVPDVYAIGDCAELKYPPEGRKSIEAVWYSGRKMGETVASTITGNPTEYQPGVWFNSAKFFDLEYQVYGTIDPQLPEEIDTLFWTDGQCRSVRINFRKKDQTVIGFNLMGVRYRQEVCEQWIKEGTCLEQVLEQLALANFDPEFTPEVESNLLAIYNERFNKQIRSKSKRDLSSVITFLKKKFTVL